MDSWIDSGAAAERLGVKPATLYSYVSRGVLRRRPSPDGRHSLFDAREVETLAKKGRPRSGPAELSIESRLTKLGKDRPYFRGRDALGLAGSASFESVAEWLWTGEPPTTPDAKVNRWQPAPAGVAAARAAQSGLGPDVLPIDRLQIIVATLAATDPMRFQLERPAVIATGRSLIASMVDALPPAGRANPEGSVARRLWSRLCARPPKPSLLVALEAALVLLADHELAASTLAARVAASVQADPYAVVTTGLGVLGGPMHGGASLAVERLLADTREPAHAARVIGEQVRRGERIPGIGHLVYKSGDARGTYLFELIRQAAPGHDRLLVADAIVVELGKRGLPALNVDFALATLGAVAGMVGGAGEAIFAIARTAGWLAHALEEYERHTPLRPRAIYTGPAILA
jgi:citrate synthase